MDRRASLFPLATGSLPVAHQHHDVVDDDKDDDDDDCAVLRSDPKGKLRERDATPLPPASPSFASHPDSVPGSSAMGFGAQPLLPPDLFESQASPQLQQSEDHCHHRAEHASSNGGVAAAATVYTSGPGSVANSSSSDAQLGAPTFQEGSVPTPDGLVISNTPLVPPPSRKLCVRHQRMADEGTTAKLQQSIESLPLTDQRAVNTVWSIFSASSHQRRALILEGILTMCCFSQLSLLCGELSNATRVDPFTLFPREISLKVLGYTDAITLGRAAQVSRRWRDLADDDLLWRSMCAQHIERKCEKCGWGLPLLSDKKRRRPPYVPPPTNAAPPAGTFATGFSTASTAPSSATSQTEAQHDYDDEPHDHHHDHHHHHPPAATPGTSSSPTPPTTEGPGGLKRSITAAANAAALEKRNRPGRPSTESDICLDSTAQESSRATKRARQDLQVSPDALEPGSSAYPISGSLSPTHASGSDVPGCGNIPVPGPNGLAPAPVLTRPWKSIYCERLVIERNWRRGRYGVKELRGHTDGIMCLKFSETLNHFPSSIVITGSYDRTARVWDLETGKELRVLRGHTRGVRCLQFDDFKLITGSMDRTLKIWNWRTGALYRTLEGHTAGIVCLHFNEDMLASGSADSEIKVWNFRSGECFTLRGHQDWINAVQLWTPPKSSTDRSSESEEQPPAFLFSASDDTTIKLWDLRTRQCLMTYEGHVTQVQSIKLTMMDPNTLLRLGQRHLSSGTSTSSRKAAPTAEETLRDRPTSSAVMARSLDDAKGVVPGQDDGTRCGYNPSNVPGGREANTNQPDLPPRFFSQAALPPTGPAIRLRRTSTPSPLRAHNSASQFVPLNPLQTHDAPHFGRQHEEDDLLHPPGFVPLKRRSKLPKHLDKLHSILSDAGLAPGLPADGELPDFYYALFEQDADSDKGTASKFTAPTPNAQPTGAQEVEDSGCAAMRPVLISGSLDNTLKVFDVLTGVCVRTIFGHVEGVWAVDVDNLRIVSASHDRTVKVWDRDTGACESTLVGHTAPVTAVALGDDKIVSGSDDRTVRIWSFSPPSSSSPVPGTFGQSPMTL